MSETLIGVTLTAYFCGLSIFVIVAMEAGDSTEEKVAIVIAWPAYLALQIFKGLVSIWRRP